MIKGLKKVVDGKVFQGIILFVIIFNAAIMGVETIKGLFRRNNRCACTY